MKIDERLLPEINIGTFGHVDHGKTTLVEAISGRRTDVHSEEQKRGITIRLGYADATIYKCPKCKEFPYCSTETCPKCFSKCEPIRTVSFVDSPGHETLMATVLTGTALIDGALLIIAADEPCPQAQTKEHLLALEIAGINKIVIIQNKIDLVSKEEAEKNYQQIKEFVKGTVAENAPIIPVSAQQRINIDAVLQAIQDYIPTPKRDPTKIPKFMIARSFDVNKPGTKPSDLKGGVIGGSLMQGELKLGEEIEIKPGVYVNGKWQPLITKIVGIRQAGFDLEKCKPGGLVGIMTQLDPALTKADALAGNVASLPNELPETLEEVEVKITLIENVEIKKNEPLLVTYAVTRTVGIVEEIKKRGNELLVKLKLKIPICAGVGEKLVISSQQSGVWHLAGWGELV